MSDMLYSFDRAAGSDCEHLYCLRIALHEQEPTLDGVQRMLMELYGQRNIKPDTLFMATQDLEDMTRKFMKEYDNRENFHYAMQYFIGKDENDMFPRHYGRAIRRIMHSGVTTYIYPLESLEHRVVIVGFMPIVLG